MVCGCWSCIERTPANITYPIGGIMQNCDVGVLGVGRMGRGIAATFLRAGLTTGVYDVDDQRMRDMARQDAALA